MIVQGTHAWSGRVTYLDRPMLPLEEKSETLQSRRITNATPLGDNPAASVANLTRFYLWSHMTDIPRPSEPSGKLERPSSSSTTYGSHSVPAVISSPPLAGIPAEAELEE
jgi:hypothetical protein